jgi:O-succinylbenzoic acid--CoA ligase
VRGESLCRGLIVNGRLVPALAADGWYHTGDAGTLDSMGRLSVRGRLDNRFISGGEKIYPEEIERVLLELPEVAQALVVAVPHPEYGHRPVAIVRCDPGEAPSAGELRAYLRGRIEAFKVPDRFYRWPEDMPTSMKPDRQTLATLLCSNRLVEII